MNKYAPHTALPLLKLKNEFYILKLESIEKDPDEWISTMEELQIQRKKFSLYATNNNEDFMIYVLNILPKEYDVTLDGLENYLTSNGDDPSTNEVVREKLNHKYKKLRL